MNHGTKATGLPDLTANLLRDGGCLIGNLFANPWKQMGIKARLNRLCFHKRSGTPAVVWHMFHAVIAGALIELKTEFGDLADKVMKTLDRHAENLFCTIPAT